jgi:serine/threonine-protein kinase HipA
MFITGERRTSQIAVCLQAAPLFLLKVNEATELIAGQIKAIKTFWKDACDTAALSEVDRNFLWRRQFLNAFAFIDAPEALVKLAA